MRVNKVRNQKALGDLLAYCMTNVTSPYSYRSLQEMLGIDIGTIKESSTMQSRQRSSSRSPTSVTH
ncbi:MAG: hypothetical protein RQM90_00975 [Methanoculleus sp.]